MDSNQKGVKQSASEAIPETDEWEASYEEDVAISCLFCDTLFKAANDVFAHCKDTHSFDFFETKNTLKLDFYRCIRMINFIRTQQKAGNSREKVLAATRDLSHEFWSNDIYLKPVLDNDPLLFGLDIEEEFDSKEVTDYKRENLELKNKIEDLQETLKKALEALKHVNLEDTATSELRKGVERQKKARGGKKQEWRKVDGKKAEKQVKTEKKKREWRKIDHDQGYFEGYGPRYIHELMLRDKVRTCAYRDFFYENKELIKDKVVLDVGCGTGILCLFAARSGAKKVIGIDRADIIDKAQEIIRANKLEHVITLIKGKVEEITLPGKIEKVDLIVSEWMGYFLLFESMLPTVLYARDTWLAPGGGVFPNKANMFLAGFEASDYHANKVDFWKDVYGFDMSCLIEDTERPTMLGSDVTTIDSKALITNVTTLVGFDLMIAQEKELDFETHFKVTVSRDHTLDGFAIWFDALFDLKCQHPITLSTSPHTPETHWKQSLFYLATAVPVKDGDVIEGILKAKRCRGYRRDYQVQLYYRLVKKGIPEIESSGTGPSRQGLYTVQDYTIS